VWKVVFLQTIRSSGPPKNTKEDCKASTSSSLEHDLDPFSVDTKTEYSSTRQPSSQWRDVPSPTANDHLLTWPFLPQRWAPRKVSYDRWSVWDVAMRGLALQMAPRILSSILSGWVPANSEDSIERMTLTEATVNYYWIAELLERAAYTLSWTVQFNCVRTLHEKLNWMFPGTAQVSHHVCQFCCHFSVSSCACEYGG